MAIDLATAETNLNLWIAADAALTGGAQSYRLNTGTTDRMVTKVDAAEIRNNIKFWNDMCITLGRNDGRGGISAVQVAPI
jgi:hypothetical protein